jgi:hypothetical protein
VKHLRKNSDPVKSRSEKIWNGRTYQALGRNTIEGKCAQGAHQPYTALIRMSSMTSGSSVVTEVVLHIRYVRMSVSMNPAVRGCALT